jgi:beta-xylosidase
LSASTRSTAPAYAGDFPDPFVLRVGDAHWAYATGSAGRNLQVMSSSDLTNWSDPQDPLPELPPWASPGLTWAPSVLSRGDLFLMYYTARDTASNRQCISVATSPRPQGPFVDARSGPLVCQTAPYESPDHYGSIDPNVYQVGGTRYLLWKSDDNATGRQTHLWGQRLSQDGLSLAGPRVKLLDSNASWQGGIIEGPAMVASGGVHYLFYGAGPWSSSAAGIGYARCSTPLGPCTNQSRLGAWLPSRPGAMGPSGPAVFVDRAGTTKLAYHAWTGPVGYDQGGARALFIDTLTLPGTGPPRLG